MIKTGIATTSLAIFESVPVRFDPLRSLWLIKLIKLDLKQSVSESVPVRSGPFRSVPARSGKS